MGGAEISRQELLDCLDSLSVIMAQSDIPQKKVTIQMDKEHVSLRDLEMRSGVCFSHLSRLFNGRSRIGLDALIRIAAAFEMSPTDFFPYDRNQRMTNGQKFDEITRGMDLKPVKVDEEKKSDESDTESTDNE